MSSELPSLRPVEMLRILQRAGWVIKRQTGSHVILINESLHRVLPVPYHSRDLKRGTLHAIIQRSGLEPEEFLRFR